MAGTRPLLRAGRALPLSLAVLGLTLTLSRAAAAEEPAPAATKAKPLPSYVDEVPEPSGRGNLALAGGIMFGVWYGAALTTALALHDEPWSREMRIPVAGPFLSLPDLVSCQKDDADCTTLIVVVRTVLASLDGVGQAGGVGILLESLFLPTRAAPRKAVPQASISAAPFVGPRGSLGVGLSGKF